MLTLNKPKSNKEIMILILKSCSTLRIKDLDKLNFIKHDYGCKILGVSQFSPLSSHLKSGQKWLKTHALLSVTHFMAKSFFECRSLLLLKVLEMRLHHAMLPRACCVMFRLDDSCSPLHLQFFALSLEETFFWLERLDLIEFFNYSSRSYLYT